MSEGLKHDCGKLRWDLLPLHLIEKVVEVYTFGAQKYAPNSWQKLEDGYNRYKAAFFRHLTAHEKGETIDPESKLPHLAHCAWNAIALLHFGTIEHPTEVLDGPTDVIESSKLIEEFDENVLLYVETFDGYQVLIENTKGAQMFSLKHLYFISQPIESLLNYKTVRTATKYEEAEYASYNKYKYKIGQPVMVEGAERPYPVVKREVSKRTLKRSYYLGPLGWYNEDEIIPYTNNQPNETTNLHQEG